MIATRYAAKYSELKAAEEKAPGKGGRSRSGRKRNWFLSLPPPEWLNFLRIRAGLVIQRKTSKNSSYTLGQTGEIKA